MSDDFDGSDDSDGFDESCTRVTFGMVPQILFIYTVV
jgi:hypothetical protein